MTSGVENWTLSRVGGSPRGVLRLIRWLLCGLGLAVLLVLALTYRIRGQTVADRVCEWVNSPGCAEWVQRERLRARSVERSVFQANQAESAGGGSPQVTVDPKPKSIPPSEEKKPLDSMTNRERQALDKLLSSRGSK
jgi:hypothetical protein